MYHMISVNNMIGIDDFSDNKSIQSWRLLSLMTTEYKWLESQHDHVMIIFLYFEMCCFYSKVDIIVIAVMGWNQLLPWFLWRAHSKMIKKRRLS